MSIFRNKLLQNLSPATIDRLMLKRVELEPGHEMEDSGNPIYHIFFIEEGVSSMTSTFRDGTQVEVGLFGYESVVGISALMGTRKSLNRIYAQIAGWGYMVPIDRARSEFALGGDFQRLTLRYVQVQLTHATQAAACNARHDLEQRLSRWLLLCADRARSSTFDLSQQFLADMLGVTRPSVSEIAGEFKRRGLIEYARGKIHIRDMKALEERACECYSVIKSHLENYTEFDPGLNEEREGIAIPNDRQIGHKNHSM
jgi:CRP-like cAMP-binding protein